MAYQRTKSVDPVASTWGQDSVERSGHQCAEAVSTQRDPSVITFKTGNLGIYEDILFAHYKELVSSSPYLWCVPNQPGQSCIRDVPSRRLNYYYPSGSIFYDWHDIDR